MTKASPFVCRAWGGSAPFHRCCQDTVGAPHGPAPLLGACLPHLAGRVREPEDREEVRGEKVSCLRLPAEHAFPHGPLPNARPGWHGHRPALWAKLPPQSGAAAKEPRSAGPRALIPRLLKGTPPSAPGARPPSTLWFLFLSAWVPVSLPPSFILKKHCLCADRAGHSALGSSVCPQTDGPDRRLVRL